MSEGPRGSPDYSRIVTEDQIGDEQVSTRNLQDEAVTEEKLSSDVAEKVNAGGVDFTEHWSGAHTVSANSTWEDWDISSIVPPDAVLVFIEAWNTDTSTWGAEVRQKGTTAKPGVNTRLIPNRSRYVCPVSVSAQKIVEVWAVRPDVEFRVVGWI